MTRRQFDFYRDDNCPCGARLHDAPAPLSWQDHGFCSLRHAIDSSEPLSLAGTPARDLASLAGRFGGPGFEKDIIRDWLKAETPEGLATLRRSVWRWPSGEESWSWRLFAGGQCIALRLTAKPSTQREKTGRETC